MSALLHFMAAAWDEPTHGRPAPDGTTVPVPAVPADHPDRPVVLAIREGDRAAFEALYLRTSDALWTFAARYVERGGAAEDVVQEVFLALWRGRAAWTPVGTIDAYLFRAVRNRALKLLRHRRVAGRAAARDAYGVTDGGEDDRPGADDRLDDVRSAIATLPERQATALRLRWEHDMTYPQIAHVLGVSPQAARTLVLRVETRLKRLVAGQSGDK